MSDDLNRHLAPIAERAWGEIEDTARRALKASLAARKLVDFEGPHGWAFSSVPLGRAVRLSDFPEDGVEARQRRTQPLLELRAPFSLRRGELDDLARGARDADLDPVIEAAQRLARAEDRLVFYGHPASGVRGLCTDSAHGRLTLSDDYHAYPEVVTQALAVLAESAVEGPYAIALGPRCFAGLSRTTAPGGYPVIKHVQQLIDGPIVSAPSIRGALVLSLRGGDFELHVGRDISIGYASHDAEAVALYLEESLTFRLLTPEAAVPLAYADEK